MEKVNHTVKIYIQVITFLIIWGAILLFKNFYSTHDLLLALKQIPTAITIYVVLGIIFNQWIWRWRLLQGWLIKLPYLQGTWRGELRSDWIDPKTGKGIDPLSVILVIKQTFTSINCTLMTKESTSYSAAADIVRMYGSEDLYLSYTYTNRPKAAIRDRSEIHDGATILKIIKKPSLALEGEYWTSRRTRGDLVLSFESRELMERYIAD